MAWTVAFHDDFEPEFEALSQSVQDALVAAALALQVGGPLLEHRAEKWGPVFRKSDAKTKI